MTETLHEACAEDSIIVHRMSSYQLHEISHH